MSDTSEPDEEPFLRDIRRQAKRAGAASHMTAWQGFALIGWVGWLIALPAVVGAFAGRWIDRRAGTGVFWTLSLLFTGLTFGCVSAWRQLHEELR